MVTSYEQDRHPAHTCMSYFLSSCPPWVKQKDLIECKIYCPNCSYRLGMLQWQGIQCSYILPMCSQRFINHKWHLGESGYSIFEIQGGYENGASSPKNQTGSGVDRETCCRFSGEACFGIRGETESRLSAVIIEGKRESEWDRLQEEGEKEKEREEGCSSNRNDTCLAYFYFDFGFVSNSKNYATSGIHCVSHLP